MTPAEIIARLESLGVRVLAPGVDRLRLVAVTGNVPPEAVELARRHKPAILAALRPDEYKSPIVPNEILAAPRVWCSQCQDALVLPELRGMTNGLCYMCSRKAANEPKGEPIR